MGVIHTNDKPLSSMKAHYTAPSSGDGNENGDGFEYRHGNIYGNGFVPRVATTVEE
jgi:hypothetical protein